MKTNLETDVANSFGLNVSCKYDFQVAREIRTLSSDGYRGGSETDILWLLLQPD